MNKIYVPKWMLILIECDDMIITEISYKTKCNHAYVGIILSELIDLHLVNKVKIGRKVIINLTEKGKKTRELILMLLNTYNKNEVQK